MKIKDIVYELECWVNIKGDSIEIHHTNNGGFPAPGQGNNALYTHPAKLIVYKNATQHLEDKDESL